MFFALFYYSKGIKKMKDNNKYLEPFTPVENYFIEKALYKYNFTSLEWSVLWVIMRNTWGKENMDIKPDLTYIYISKATNINRVNVAHVMKRLKADNIITQFKTSNYKNKWYINCNYSEWKREPRAELEKLHQCNNGNENPGEPRAEPSAEDPGETMAAEPSAENLAVTPSGYIYMSDYLQLTKDKPHREIFKTSAEHGKALKWYEIEKGLYKPTKRDYKDEGIYNQAIELYTKGAAALQKYIIKPLIKKEECMK